MSSCFFSDSCTPTRALCQWVGRTPDELEGNLYSVSILYHALQACQNTLGSPLYNVLSWISRLATWQSISLAWRSLQKISPNGSIHQPLSSLIITTMLSNSTPYKGSFSRPLDDNITEPKKNATCFLHVKIPGLQVNEFFVWGLSLEMN